MKFNLFTFFQKYYSKLIIFFSIVGTLFFIGIYRKLPDRNFDFLIYALAILYSFLFFIIGIFQTIVLNSFEKNYSSLKRKYVSCKELYLSHSIFKTPFRSFPSPSDSKSSHFNLKTLPDLNLRLAFFEKPNLMSWYKIAPDSIKFGKVYRTFEDFIVSRDWEDDKFSTKFVYFVYRKLQSFYSYRFKTELIRVEKHFGERLFNDILEEKENAIFRETVNNKLDDIEFYISELRDQFEDC